MYWGIINPLVQLLNKQTAQIFCRVTMRHVAHSYGQAHKTRHMRLETDGYMYIGIQINETYKLTYTTSIHFMWYYVYNNIWLISHWPTYWPSDPHIGPSPHYEIWPSKISQSEANLKLWDFDPLKSTNHISAFHYEFWPSQITH